MPCCARVIGTPFTAWVMACRSFSSWLVTSPFPAGPATPSGLVEQCSQLVLDHLAAGVARQLLNEEDAGGLLVAGQPAAEEPAHLLQAQRAGGHDRGGGCHAEHRVGQAEHG